MRALTYSAYGPIDNLSLEEMSAPRPRSGELVVDVRRAALDREGAIVRKGVLESKRARGKLIIEIR